MNAKKLPSGRWRAKGSRTINGERVVRSFTADTKARAEMLATTWVHNGIDDFLRPTVSKVMDDYISHREAVLSPSTLRGYKLIAKEIKERFEGVCASDMTSEKVQAYINELSADKSPKTIKNYVNFLTSALNAYMPDRKFRFTMPKRPPMQYHVPDDDAVKALLDATTGDLHLCILLGAVGGLRRGEIAALKGEDVNRDLHCIYIHADIVRDENGKWIYKDMPKNVSSIRKVDLPPFIIDLIPDTDGFIINHPPVWITDRFCEVRNKLGLKCRFHDLRHYCASYLHSIGIPDQYIQERGGWKTDTTLKSVYRNTLTDKSIRFAKKANESFEETLKKKEG